MFSKELYWFSWPVVKTYVGTMLKMDVKLHEKMPEGPKIIAANHPSTTDPFFVASIAHCQVFILISDLLFQVPVLGTYLRHSGHIPVKTGEGAVAIQSALDYLAAGKSIVIFPEGDLSPAEGRFHQAHTGVARLALMSGAPVIPVGIHLAFERIHSIRSTVKGRVEYGRWYLNGPYNMTVGRPLRFQGDVEDRGYVRRVAGSVMHHIIEMARQSEQRLRPGPAPINTLPAAR
ncbi:MAG: 1-acyl-sn-glycerol-3-phosphate acyltransferase [Anaerolineaceae bacterium]|nr:1-acyl-sn-glycerol-3-phosphate acyltransferase [Anaerolineaceae bacterium]